MARDPSALRRKVLDASIALVAEQGVRAVSFREVARRAGVSHQTPYHHFGDHRGILRAIAREGFAALSKAMRDASTAAGHDPVDGLTAAGIAYVTFARDHLGHFRVMFQRALVDVHDPDAPMPEAEATYATVVRLCTEAHEAGHGRGLSVETLTATAWSLVHGLATLMTEGVLARKHDATGPASDLLIDEVVRGLGRLLRS